MIVYLAAISNIDQSLYEAAQIDGAGRWKQTLYVTIPCILPMVIVMATLSLGNVLNAGFDQIFNLYSPLFISFNKKAFTSMFTPPYAVLTSISCPLRSFVSRFAVILAIPSPNPNR
jgi:ABC-type polysaccharide transport system permease subunit